MQALIHLTFECADVADAAAQIESWTLAPGVTIANGTITDTGLVFNPPLVADEAGKVAVPDSAAAQ